MVLLTLQTSRGCQQNSTQMQESMQASHVMHMAAHMLQGTTHQQHMVDHCM
jgi:hypothetical protein